MDRTVLLSMVLALAVVLLLLMIVGWRARQRRQSDLVAPAERPGDAGEPLASSAGKYVATTRAGQPLERVAVHGLGFRGSVRAEVFAAGVLLDRTGERDVWIPIADLDDHGRGTWTIDRVVEPDGLTVLTWRLGGIPVDTYLRLDAPEAIDVALNSALGRSTR